MRSRFLSVLAALVVVALAMSACAPPAPPAPAGASPTSAAKARAGGTFTFGQSGDAAVIDPWNVTDGNSLQVTEQIYDTLVDYEPTGFKIVPRLATKWEKSADGTQWTFTLREGVKFHDGTDFDAEAVVFNFERGRNTKHQYRGKPIADQYQYYESMWNGFDNDSVITKVEAVDKKTVRFTTKTPFAPFLANMGMNTFGIVSPKSVKDDPDNWATPGSKGAAGTGPFVFKPGGWQKDQQITLERNPSYWQKDSQGQQLPYVDKVVIRFVKDTQARLAELKAGTLDAAHLFSPADIPTVKGDPNLQIIPRPSFNVAYLGVNHTKAPLDKVDVRKAVAMAINKKAIAETIYGGAARPASQFLPPGIGMVGYDDAVKDFYPYDPDQAKKLLQQAGATNLKLDFWYMPVSRPYYPEPKRIAEAFASDLAKVGITAELRTVDWTTYRKQARANEYSLWLLGWTGDNGDPDNWLCVFFCPLVKDGKDLPIQGGGWSNPAAWKLLRDAARETDQARRDTLYKQVSKIVQDEIPRIPMFHADQPVFASKKVQGFQPHPKGSEPFTLVWLSR